ncbi:MAG: FtsX-like permease family protein [Calditrichota bacterium]
MTLFKMALKQIWRAGIRTWLNVLVLALTIIVIVFTQGFNQGIIEQVSTSMIRSEIGGGQYWHPEYDAFNPLSLDSSNQKITPEIKNLIQQNELTPVLIRQASLYPEGRLVAAVAKGIPPDQQILDFPTSVLNEANGIIPALIGKRMAKSTGLQKGDYVTVRWRDGNGTFDARDVEIVHVMQTDAAGIDMGQIWLPLQTLQELTLLQNHATMLISAPDFTHQNLANWSWKGHDVLLKDIRDLVRARNIGSSILYLLLLFLGLLAVFDTQILSLFRRRKEIGTLVALGMTREKVVRLFTVEGGMHAILAVGLALILGAPLLYWMAQTGVPIPEISQESGLSIGNVLYPRYTPELIVGTIVLMLLAVTFVSWLPVRRVARLNPTDALRGRIR